MFRGSSHVSILFLEIFSSILVILRDGIGGDRSFNIKTNMEWPHFTSDDSRGFEESH